MKTIFVDMERCVACRTCEIACALHRSSLSHRLPEAIYEETPPLSRVRVEPTGTEKGFPIQCRHCEDAPCLDACPAGALYRDEEGLVLVHDQRCIGCWMCVMVWPFWGPPAVRQFPKIIKCDRCKGMEAVYCVESCPTKALVLADPEEMAKGRNALKKEGKWVGLNFISETGVTK